MYSDILSQIKTKEDVDTLTSETMAVLEVLGSPEKLEEVLATKVRSKIKNTLKIERDYLKGLLKALESLEPIRLNLAYELSSEQVSKVSEWVGQNTGEPNYLELGIDKSLLGGAEVSCKGKYYNGSLVHKIEKYLEKNKVEILEKLRNETV